MLIAALCNHVVSCVADTYQEGCYVLCIQTGGHLSRVQSCYAYRMLLPLPQSYEVCVASAALHFGSKPAHPKIINMES